MVGLLRIRAASGISSLVNEILREPIAVLLIDREALRSLLHRLMSAFLANRGGTYALFLAVGPFDFHPAPADIEHADRDGHDA